ncbi:MAG: hypothetical protein PHY93_14525 [Bacteriovorax sp.]|nr:hypothetical protein [Bacteriovorax sp.]
MRIIVLFILILSTIFSCSFNKNSIEAVEKSSIKDEWDLISKIEKEKWNKEKIIKIFGIPGKIYNEEKDPSESLIYYDLKLGYQNWAFDIKKDGSLEGFLFIPNFSNRKNFSQEIIKSNWKEDCVKKVETDLSQHFIRKIYYLQCGKYKRVDLTNHDEVTSLSIQIK